MHFTYMCTYMHVHAESDPVHTCLMAFVEEPSHWLDLDRVLRDVTSNP